MKNDSIYTFYEMLVFVNNLKNAPFGLKDFRR